MKTPVPVLFLLLLGLSLAPGQAPVVPTAPESPAAEPVELTQLRQQFALRALAASRTLAEQFAGALAGLARDAGVEGDYEQALQAQRRRQDLAEMYIRSLNDPTLSNVIVLKPADARLNGSVAFDKASSTLTNWRTIGGNAYWDVQKIAPGKYEVLVTYSVAPMGEPPSRTSIYSSMEDLATGGEFEFYEDSSLPGASLNRRSVQVTSTGGWDSPATQRLAPIQLARTTGRFGIKITRTRGNGGVMRLTEVRLVPVKEGESPPLPAATPFDGPPSLPAVDEVTRINEAAAVRLRKVVEPVVGAYADRLDRLAAEAQARNDEEAAKELLAEAAAVRAVQENPSSISTARSAGLPAGTLGGQGFEEWPEATFVPSPTNTGDRFLISHDGATIPVRLLWVTCPPPLPEPAAETKACAAYFNLAMEDATLVGRLAKAFTESYLQGKPLRVMSRRQKDKDGNLLVVVQPEGVGDFAGVLVDNGLACVNPPTGKSRTARRFEEAFLQALKEREVAAKDRPIPPGAWAMTRETDASPSN